MNMGDLPNVIVNCTIHIGNGGCSQWIINGFGCGAVLLMTGVPRIQRDGLVVSRHSIRRSGGYSQSQAAPVLSQYCQRF